jgi:hypothetical protein
VDVVEAAGPDFCFWSQVLLSLNSVTQGREWSTSPTVLKPF